MAFRWWEERRCPRKENEQKRGRERELWATSALSSPHAAFWLPVTLFLSLSSQGPRLPRAVGSYKLPGGCRESTNPNGTSTHLSLPRLSGHALRAGASATQDPTGRVRGCRDRGGDGGGVKLGFFGLFFFWFLG